MIGCPKEVLHGISKAFLKEDKGDWQEVQKDPLVADLLNDKDQIWKIEKGARI